MKMNMQTALAILAWFEAVDARAFPQPQIIGLPTTTLTGAAGKTALPGLLPPVPAVPVPVSGQPLGGAGLLSAVPAPGVPSVPLAIPNLASSLPKLPTVNTLPAVLNLPLDNLPKPSVSLPNLADLSLPTAPKVPGLGDLPVSPPDASVDNFVKIGKVVFKSILDILTKGLEAVRIPGVIAAPINSTLPVVGTLEKRQLGLPALPATASPVSAALPVVGGLVGGATGGAASSPLGGVVGTVANTAASLPVVGSAAAPVTNTLGGITSGSPLGSVGSTVSGTLNTVGGAAGGLPVVGGTAQGAVNTVSNTVASTLPGPYPISQGVPGSDPVGGLSISIIATLLSLLKKDPLSLFGGLGGAGGLIKRDLPHLSDTFEIEKRQIAGLLPSLSSGVPGVGIGSLPLSGIPGVSPDLAFLVGSIAKNIAVPGGKGLGSVTGNILTVLNGVVPNFLFQLPVVQDSVPTFGALQLLSSINPAKFGSLSDLTNLANLSRAAASITPSDLAFIRTLPVSADPTNLITTITTLVDNILSLTGNVVNIRAAVSVLCMRNLGLSVPGL